MNPKIDAWIAAPIYTAQSKIPTIVDEKALPPISPATAQITPVTIPEIPTTSNIALAGICSLMNGKQIIPQNVTIDANANIGSRFPLNTLSVINGNTNIAHACPIGNKIELKIPCLIDNPNDSVKYVGTQVNNP